MRSDDQRKLDEALAVGFFADRVVDVLRTAGPTNPETERILTRARDHVKMALEGQKNVTSGKLSSRSAENIHAYSRAMEAAVIELPAGDKFMKSFRGLLENVLEETNDALKKKSVDPSQMEATRRYFDSVRRSTIRASSTFFREEPNAPTWLLADR